MFSSKAPFPFQSGGMPFPRNSSADSQISSEDLPDYPHTLIEEVNNIAYCTDTENFIYAYDAETKEKIGSLEIADNDGELWLDYIEVDEDRQRKGIGSQLLKLAKREFGPFWIACVQDAAAYKYSLTHNGEALVAFCIHRGILDQAQLRFSGSVPLEHSSEDPGYNCPSLLQYRTSGVQALSRSTYSDDDQGNESGYYNDDYASDSSSYRGYRP